MQYDKREAAQWEPSNPPPAQDDIYLLSRTSYTAASCLVLILERPPKLQQGPSRPPRLTASPLRKGT
jgi:hypothetical protein